MADAPLTYWDFAERDHASFREAYDNGIRGSVLAPLGRDICVRYLKYMVSEYGGGCTGAEQNARENALRTNNLQVLVRHIQRNIGDSHSAGGRGQPGPGERLRHANCLSKSAG